jgi:hypothetical protein
MKAPHRFERLSDEARRQLIFKDLSDCFLHRPKQRLKEAGPFAFLILNRIERNVKRVIRNPQKLFKKLSPNSNNCESIVNLYKRFKRRC